jgi:hypothetical protein
MIPAETKLYKVVGPAGEAIHGGSGTWLLPNGDEAAEWMPPIVGRLQACVRGYHLTPTPIEFWAPESRVFEAEWRGDIDDEGLMLAAAKKVAVRECRLLRELDWSEFSVWFEGEHELHEGVALVSGSAQATLYGSAQATLSDSARATLYGSAQATLSGSAQATLYDSAQATLYDSAQAISDRWHSPSAKVALADLAAHIDRRDGKLVLRKAKASRKAVP